MIVDHAVWVIMNAMCLVCLFGSNQHNPKCLGNISPIPFNELKGETYK